MGACRSNELYEMKIEDVKDFQTELLITIPKTKTKIVRKFTINSTFYNIVKKYIDLRPSHVETNSFFLNYQKSKCTIQRIGKNKFADIGRQIAKYLNLPNPQSYTGHCYRRSSATLYIDGGGDITGLKRHGGWKSTQVAEGYIDQSMRNKTTTADTIAKQINSNEATSSFTATGIPNIRVENSSKVNHNSRPIQFINCTITNLNVIDK